MGRNGDAADGQTTIFAGMFLEKLRVGIDRVAAARTVMSMRMDVLQKGFHN